ncbi:hypothetical protein [Nonomuraea mesophila]|uniref:hypothetical protein n=1 Tax=Nonomuraea mesophila TaxID=2530382 RepID=UPI001FE40C96|nr:hypothetical protein [Nonomuraea mesophila]
MATHLIQGRAVGMPVRVRDAEICGAFYPVRADAARAVIACTGCRSTSRWRRTRIAGQAAYAGGRRLRIRR